MIASHRVALNTGFLYARMAITVFISLYVTRLILAALGVENFGIFNVVGGAVVMLTFLNNAMASATQRFMSYSQGEGNKNKQKIIFNVSFIIHIGLAIIIALLLEGAGYFLFNGILKIDSERMDAAKLIYQFLIVSTFVKIISVPYDAVLNAHENMLFVSFLGIFEALLKLSIAFYITITHFDKLESYGFLMACLSIFLLVIQRIYCTRRYEEVQLKPKKYFDKEIFKEMTGFATLSLLSSGASLITMQGISILLNSFFGVIVNAAQGVSNQISGQLMAFSNTMLKALNPVIVKSEGDGNRNLLIKASLTGNKFSFLLFAFFSIPTFIEMPFILGIWLKEIPEYSIIFCRLSLIRMIVAQLFVTFGTAIGATGKIRNLVITESIIYFLLLPISYVMFKFGMGPEMIYINLVFMVIALSSAKIYFMKLLCGLEIGIFLKDVVKPCLIVSLGTTGAALIPTLLMSESLMRLTFVLMLSSVMFLFLFFSIGMNTDELRHMHSMKNRMFKSKFLK